VNEPALNSHGLSAALQAGGELTRSFDAVWQRLWTQTHMPAAVLELCRLRLGQLHGAPNEIAAATPVVPDAAKHAAVVAGNYAGPDFSDGERAVLEFTEIYAQDPMAISDELADAVKQHFGEPGLVCLVESLGFIDGRIRLALMFSALQANPAH
jgi:alkylhydroperoxidase family enzyme